MKIDINKIKVVPKALSTNFELCIFGIPTPEIQEWISVNSFKSYVSDNKYTNIILPQDVVFNDIFFEAKQYEWLDGFSPNLNKKLHIGHFSNLVLGKAFKSLGVAKKTISIYGDTLDGEIKKEDAILLLNKYQEEFDFKADKSCMASEMIYTGNLLVDGTGDYNGAKVFVVEQNQLVGIKSNGSTSYFYQDVVLAEMLNSPTLYLTGAEQCNHFELLKKLFPYIQHIGLGLVKVSGKKMASRVGNVIFIEDFIDQVKNEFDNNMQLIYNVFAGFILKSTPDADKGINLDIISNAKNSAGLYLSYTMARLNSAGCETDHLKDFNAIELKFAYLKAKTNLKPNILFEALVEHCKEINSLYNKHTIKGDEENKKMFSEKLADLILGAEKLGLFIIKKV